MDHRVSKDMISSGMTPSGEKSQADLGKSQYGSAPSPSRLMDAYHSMYQNQKEETLKEGKVNSGLQAYLDKKKGKKDDDDENGDEKKGKKGKGGKPDFLDLDKDGDKNEPMKKASKEMKKEEYDNTKSPDYKKKRKALAKKHGGEKNIKGHPQYEGVDVFDLVSTKLIEEGYDEKDVYKVMANLTEEQLNEIVITGTLAALAAKGALAGKAAAGALAAGKGAALAAGKGALAAGKGALSAAKGAVAAKGGAIKSAASNFKTGLMTKPTSSTKITGDVMKSAAPKSTPVSTAQKAGQIARKGAAYAKDNPLATYSVASSIGGGGGGNQQQTQKTNKTGQRTTVSASADLFDIVKGKLLDEGLDEKEIKEIMIFLTPEEIMNEMAVNPKIAAMDAKNKANMIKNAKAKEVPQNVRDAAKRQYKAGTSREDPKNPYTTDDKKTIINQYKDK